MNELLNCVLEGQIRCINRRCLLDHLIRPVQDDLRNREAHLLRGFEIDDQLKLCRLLNRKVTGLRALEDLVDVSGGSTGGFSSSGFIQNVFKPNCCYHDDLRSHDKTYPFNCMLTMFFGSII